MIKKLFLDNSAERCKAARMLGGCQTVFTVLQFETSMRMTTWDEVYLDHDLGSDGESSEDAHGKTGMDAVRFLETRKGDRLKVVVHSLNAPAAERMVERLKKSGHEVERIPFTELLRRWREQ